MSYPKIHGIEFADNGFFQNLTLETLTSDPSLSVPGRLWFDGIDNVLRGTFLDSLDNVVAQDIIDRDTINELVTKLQNKDSAKCATTESLTVNLSAFPATLDGVSLSVGDRVLVKDADIATENGIYAVQSDNGDGSVVIARATDADGTPDGEVTKGMYCFVTHGTVNAGKGYLLITNNPITIGVSDLDFVRFSSSGNITAGDAIEGVSGGTFSIKLDGTTIEKTGSGIRVSPALIKDEIIELDDTPVSYGTAGQVLKVNSTEDGLEWDLAPLNVYELEDIPSYVANGVLMVNPTGDGVLWGNPFSALQTELDTLQTTSGLTSDGVYSPPVSNYLGTTTTITDALDVLDDTLFQILSARNNGVFTFESSTASTSYSLTHNLNTVFIDVTCWVYNSVTSSWHRDYEDIAIDDSNNITITLTAAENIKVIIRSAENLSL